MPQTRKIRLRYDRFLAPGDYVVTTGLLRDAAATYGSQKLQLRMESNRPEIFANSPHQACFASDDTQVEEVVIGYRDGMDSSMAGNKHHFMCWLYKDFEDKTGIKVPCLKPRPDLHISEERRRTPPVSGRYWLLFGGGKSDFTVKHWDFQRYKLLAERLTAAGINIVQTGADAPGHVHPRIDGTLDLVGWGGLQEMFWQVAHAEGVICPITAGMHVAAAFEKPCVVIAGGREEPWWEAYNSIWGQFGQDAVEPRVPHRYLHTLGELPCCADRGCWVNKVVATPKDKNACWKPARRPLGMQPLPACMELITVEQVEDAVLSYYFDGTLLPLPEDRQEPSELLSLDVSWSPKKSAAIMSNAARVRPGSAWSKERLGDKLTVAVCFDGTEREAGVRAVLRSIDRTVPRRLLQLKVMAPLASKSMVGVLASEIFGNTVEVRTLDHPDNPVLPLKESEVVAWFSAGSEIRHQGWVDLAAESLSKQVKRDVVLGSDLSFFVTYGGVLPKLDFSLGLKDAAHAAGAVFVPFNRGQSLVSHA